MESATYELQQHLENSNSDVSAASEVLQSSIKVPDILTVGPIVKNDAPIMMKKIVMIMMMMEEAWKGLQIKDSVLLLKLESFHHHHH